MLIEFRAANHRSLRDEQVLTMEAGRVGDESDPRPRKVAGYPEKLLTVAGLYGPNASGKSNVLAALGFMREAVIGSHQLWSPEEGVPRNPFAWGTKKTEPSLFEVTLLTNGVRFQYGFLVTDECIIEEWLSSWPRGKKQNWFTRCNSDYKFGDNLKGENKLIQDVTRSNALFLSAAVQHNHPQLKPLYSWFHSLQPINLSLGGFSVPHRWSTDREFFRMIGNEKAYPGKESSSHEKQDSGGFFEYFRDVLKSADIGILDLRVENKRAGEKGFHFTPHFYLKHQSESSDAWLSLKDESKGTQTLFYLALPISKAIHNGGILVVDELERSLHPYLARQIINQFNNPETNPNNAQLIFTTHDTNLLGTMLGEPALRRDQVWLTEKNPEGATELYPLTNYKPRKAENIERGYLQGRYGAIPFVEDFSVAGE